MATARAAFATGTLFALAAGLMWGMVFIAPRLLPAYPAAVLSVGRYLAFGLIALPLAWLDRQRLRQLSRADWIEALKLSAVGNLLYYGLLAAAIQRAGVPLPTMIIGTLPVVIAIVANWRSGQQQCMPWLQLAPSLALICVGMLMINQAELAAVRGNAERGFRDYLLGGLLAVGALACWTWYPLRNADWLRAHGDRSPTTWATAQGLTTLPLAAAGAMLLVIAQKGSGSTFPLPFGPTPGLYLLLMATLGLCASWLGTLCWNEASRRLPTTLVGQLIVFETLAAFAYAFVYRREWPSTLIAAGIALMVAGIIWALRVRPEPSTATAAGAPH